VLLFFSLFVVVVLVSSSLSFLFTSLLFAYFSSHQTVHYIVVVAFAFVLFLFEIMNSDSLESLSKTSGVDLVKLREKFQAVKNNNLTVNDDVGLSTKHEDVSRSGNSISNYKICPECNGMGVTKSIYNHMVMTKDCEMCDGESIVDIVTKVVLKDDKTLC
jgi:hypothetical protein